MRVKYCSIHKFILVQCYGVKLVLCVIVLCAQTITSSLYPEALDCLLENEKLRIFDRLNEVFFNNSNQIGSSRGPMLAILNQICSLLDPYGCLEEVLWHLAKPFFDLFRPFGILLEPAWSHLETLLEPSQITCVPLGPFL